MVEETKRNCQINNVKIRSITFDDKNIYISTYKLTVIKNAIKNIKLYSIITILQFQKNIFFLRSTLCLVFKLVPSLGTNRNGRGSCGM